jgi:AmmeMemoRadiSam system protein B
MGCNSGLAAENMHKSHFLDSHYSVFCDRPDFFEESIAAAQHHIKNSRRVPLKFSGLVQWGVVSHHLLIKNLIAEFFLRLSGEIHPKTIVLIGPNHFSEGHHRIAVSRLPWKTPFGMINPNQNIIKLLVDSGVATVDEDAFTREHSVSALVPFIKYFFPGVSIVPIVLWTDIDTLEATHLAKSLSAFAGQETFFLASLDFSHYKKNSVAEKEDVITLDILYNFDTKNYRRAFVDSRATMFVMLNSCKEIGSTAIEILHHTNSGIIENDSNAPCTSYINALMWNSR